MTAARSAHERGHDALIRAFLPLLVSALLAASAGAAEPEAVDEATAVLTSANGSAFPDELPSTSARDPEAPPLFLVTFDDYFWLDTSGSIDREVEGSLLYVDSFRLRTPDDPALGRYKLRKFKLIRYDRWLNLANRDVLLKVRSPGKRKSIMSLELKF
jgi:hypothetical protein